MGWGTHLGLNAPGTKRIGKRRTIYDRDKGQAPHYVVLGHF